MEAAALSGGSEGVYIPVAQKLAVVVQLIGQRKQSVLPKQFGLAQPLQPSLVL